MHDQTSRAMLLALVGGYVAGGFPSVTGLHPAWGVVLACSVAVLAVLLTPHDDEIAMDFIIEEDLVVVEEDEIEGGSA